MGVKIAVIGAGSAVFSLNLTRDLCLTPNLAGSAICLMDVNQRRLDAVSTLCRRYADELGIALFVEQTTDRAAALSGADFVIHTALAASHDRLQAGWEVARRHGYRFGGSLHVMHDEAFWINYYQLRLMESLAADMLMLCPNAYLLLVANPVLAGITYLGRKYPQLRAVGLCHGYVGVYSLARVLGLEPADITYQIPGVNHFVWLTKFYHKGQDAFPLLDEWIATHAESYFERCPPGDAVGPVAVDLYRRFGVFPIGDTCTAGGGSWPYWYHTSDEVEKEWREDPAGWWDGFFRHMTEHFSSLEQISQNASRRVSEAFPPKLSGEVMIPMIEAIACDKPRVLIGNIPNTLEFVPGVPKDFAVEIPLLCSAQGIQGIQTTGLPQPVLSFLLRDRVAPVNLELEAYTSGALDVLEELVLSDPFTCSLDQARSLIREILDLEFHSEMRRHYS